MKLSLWLRHLLFGFGMTLAANATSLTYNIQFSGGSPTPTSGSFTYDTAAQQFTAFDVFWDGVDVNFLPSANRPVTQNNCMPLFTGPLVYAELTGNGQTCGGLPVTFTWNAYPPNPPGNLFTEELDFHFFNANSSGAVIGGPALIPSPLPFTSGTFTVALASPEPASAVLTMTGISLLLLRMRKRRRAS